MSQDLICPIMRSFVTETPYLTGQGAAYIQHKLGPTLNTTTQEAQNLYNRVIETAPAKAATIALKKFQSLRSAALNLQFYAAGLQQIRNQAQRVAFITAPLVFLYLNAPHIIPERTFIRINTIAAPITTGLITAFQTGLGLIGKINSLVYTPYNYGFKAAFVGCKAAVYIITHKAVAIPTAIYLISRPTYKIMCGGYERNLKKDSTHKPLGLFESLSRGYLDKRLSYPLSPKQHLNTLLRAAKNENQRTQIAKTHIENLDISECTIPYNHSKCFCGLTDTNHERAQLQLNRFYEEAYGETYGKVSFPKRIWQHLKQLYATTMRNM